MPADDSLQWRAGPFDEPSPTMNAPGPDLRERMAELENWLATQVIGQDLLVNRLLTALLCGGHLLVEGAPGLAKTRAVKALAQGIEGSFHRIQFTPDLLPSDVTGTDIYRPETASFEFQRGPVFHNLVLADEVNRAPAKVQSALLEAMAERQVSIGRETYRLPDLFLVMATQNPIEQEGTYNLPEAQLDRFLMHVLVDYPDAEAEQRILSLVRAEAVESSAESPVRIQQAEIFAARRALAHLHMEPAVETYIVQLVMATRQSQRYDPELAQWIEFGASPRATISLDACARAVAWLDGRNFVSPTDVQNVAHDVLRHRIIVSFEAEANAIDSQAVIDRLLERVAAP